MSEAEVQAAAEPVVLEYGRYRLFESPDGGLVVARAWQTCERCEHCGCGEQAEPIVIPGMIVKMARAQQGGGGLLAKFRAVVSGGNGSAGQD